MTDPERRVISPEDQERPPGSTHSPASVKPCVQPSANHLHEGATETAAAAAKEREFLCGNVESPTALDPDGLNPCLENVLLPGERLAREPVLYEHFNPLPKESQGRMSRTEMTDGRDGGTPRPESQDTATLGRLHEDNASAVDECPICTESYCPKGERTMVLLNCDHTMCQSCLCAMLTHACDCGCVRCPLCRQRTPVLRWEVCRLQEAAGLLSPPRDATILTTRSETEPARVPGLCRRVEEYLVLRVETTRVWGCFEHPRWLVRAVRRTQLCCRCCYVTLLLALYLVELSFLALVSLPIVVLVLLFTLAR